MESTPLSIKEHNMAQLRELLATAGHNLRNLTFDQACILFGIAFPDQVAVDSVSLQVDVESAGIQDDDNLLLLSWNAFVPEFAISMFMDISDCESDEEIGTKNVTVPSNIQEAIIEYLRHWKLMP
jgi:hypothetical protein